MGSIFGHGATLRAADGDAPSPLAAVWRRPAAEGHWRRRFGLLRRVLSAVAGGRRGLAADFGGCLASGGVAAAEERYQAVAWYLPAVHTVAAAAVGFGMLWQMQFPTGGAGAVFRQPGERICWLVGQPSGTAGAAALGAASAGGDAAGGTERVFSGRLVPSGVAVGLFLK